MAKENPLIVADSEEWVFGVRNRVCVQATRVFILGCAHQLKIKRLIKFLHYVLAAHLPILKFNVNDLLSHPLHKMHFSQQRTSIRNVEAIESET